MTELPSMLVPGLISTPDLFARQLPTLWSFGPVTVADHHRDESMEAIARRILKDAPPRFALPAIKCPTLILVGDGDQLTPSALSEEMAGLIPNSRLEIVAECGHLSTLEQPGAVNRALVEWMR